MQRPSNNAVTLTFGVHAGYPLNNGLHKGVDFSPSNDNVIYAPEDGVYTLSPNDGTLGNAVYCTVGNRKHAFGHTSKYLIASGQFCKRGTPLAVMGATGAADGVHLHWALTINGVLVDPLSQVNEAFIKGGEMTIPDQDNWFNRFNKLMVQMRGREISRDEFKKNFVGVESFKMVEVVSDSPEADQATTDQALGRIARVDNWSNQISTLRYQMGESEKALRVREAQAAEMDADKKAWVSRATTAEDALSQSMKAVESSQKEVNDLKAKLAIQSEDTQLLNGFGMWLKKLITRLGMKA